MTEFDYDTERARIDEIARIENRALDEERTRRGNAAPAEVMLTHEERAQHQKNAKQEARNLTYLVAHYRRDVAGRTEEELIAEAPRSPQIRHPLELNRRLIDSNRHLQSELAKSRESSEQLASSLNDQMTKLTRELVNFRTSSDTLARRVVWWSRALAGLTAALLIGTAVLIYLTIVLVQRATPNPAEAAHPATHASTPNRPAIRLQP